MQSFSVSMHGKDICDALIACLKRKIEALEALNPTNQPAHDAAELVRALNAAKEETSVSSSSSNTGIKYNKISTVIQGNSFGSMQIDDTFYVLVPSSVSELSAEANEPLLKTSLVPEVLRSQVAEMNLSTLVAKDPESGARFFFNTCYLFNIINLFQVAKY
jgi:hypothetical protein